jgi:ABC-2 type transport system permease protein
VTLRTIMLIAMWDLMKLKNQKVFIAMRLAWFVVQIIVFARAISYVVSTKILHYTGGVDYYLFYILGVYTTVLYTTGIARGYMIAEEFDDGIVEYHLSLPVKRDVLAVGRVLGGSVSTLIFTLPMMAVVYAMLGVRDLFTIVVAIISALVFSAGVVSFVVLIVFAIKSTDLTDIIVGAIDALLVRLSTVFYPLPVILATGIAPYYVAAALNPISHMSDFLRLLVFPEYYIVTQHGPVASILYILGFSTGLLILAIEFYEKKAEAGGWR